MSPSRHEPLTEYSMNKMDTEAMHRNLPKKVFYLDANATTNKKILKRVKIFSSITKNYEIFVEIHQHL